MADNGLATVILFAKEGHNCAGQFMTLCCPTGEGVGGMRSSSSTTVMTLLSGEPSYLHPLTNEHFFFPSQYAGAGGFKSLTALLLTEGEG